VRNARFRRWLQLGDELLKQRGDTIADRAELKRRGVLLPVGRQDAFVFYLMQI
jgi:hypothetical protein